MGQANHSATLEDFACLPADAFVLCEPVDQAGPAFWWFHKSVRSTEGTAYGAARDAHGVWGCLGTHIRDSRDGYVRFGNHGSRLRLSVTLDPERPEDRTELMNLLRDVRPPQARHVRGGCFFQDLAQFPPGTIFIGRLAVNPGPYDKSPRKGWQLVHSKGPDIDALYGIEVGVTTKRPKRKHPEMVALVEYASQPAGVLRWATEEGLPFLIDEVVQLEQYRELYDVRFRIRRSRYRQAA